MFKSRYSFYPISALIIFVCFLSCKDKNKVSLGSCENTYYSSEFTGEATYYDGSAGMGNCMIEFPSDKMYAAMNASQYANSNACGGFVEITNEKNGNQVIVQILDQCPECKSGDIDLSPEAFEKLAPLEEGRIAIKWKYIKCPDNRNMSVRFKDGSNPYWVAVQAINHKYLIQSIEAKNQNGEFFALNRKSYNYFVAENGIKNGEDGPFELRITDVAGHSITSVFEFNIGVIIPTNLQFEDCN